MPNENTLASFSMLPATRLGDFLAGRLGQLARFSRKLAFWRWSREEGYVFRIDADEVGFRLYDRLFQAYLDRFPHRYASGRIEEVPELVLALTHLPGTELENFTLYVISQLNRDRDRFDFQFYSLVSDLLRQLLDQRPWGNEAGLRRIGEALYFTSPHGYEGVVYWPLLAYLRAVRASYGGRRPHEQVAQVLEVIAGELRGYFAFGFNRDVEEARRILAELLAADQLALRA